MWYKSSFSPPLSSLSLSLRVIQHSLLHLILDIVYHDFQGESPGCKLLPYWFLNHLISNTQLGDYSRRRLKYYCWFQALWLKMIGWILYKYYISNRSYRNVTMAALILWVPSFFFLFFFWILLSKTNTI